MTGSLETGWLRVDYLLFIHPPTHRRRNLSRLLDLTFTTLALHALRSAARCALAIAATFALLTTLCSVRPTRALDLSVQVNLTVAKDHLPHSRAGRGAPEHEFGGGRPPAAPQARGWARGGNPAVDADEAAKARYGGAAPHSPFRLLGQVADDDAEIGWTRFRCFDAESGRWLTPDPMGVEGGIDLNGFNGAPSFIADPLGLTTGGGASGGSPHGSAPLTHHSGTTKPPTTGGTPNSVYTHIDPKTGKAVQNAVYDDKGQVVAHIDFKNHGKDPATKTEAVSGHGHTFSTPGDPSTGHGAGKTHYPPGALPPEYSQLPAGVQPHTPLGQ